MPRPVVSAALKADRLSVSPARKYHNRLSRTSVVESERSCRDARVCREGARVDAEPFWNAYIMAYIGAPAESFAPGRILPGTRPVGAIPWDDVAGSVPRRFESQVEQQPDSLAVVDGFRRWTYDELNRKSNRLAHRLLARLGAAPAPVAILFDLEADMFTAIYGILKAGKFYVALDPHSPPARLRSLLEAMDAPVLITNTTHDALAGMIIPAAAAVLHVERDAGLRDDNLVLEIPNDQLAYVMYTSGSTGMPKGVMQTHENLLVDMLRQGRDLATSSADRYGLLFPAWSSAACCSVFGALLNGAAVCCFDLHRNPVAAMAQWFVENEITICDITVAALRLFAASLKGGERFPKLRMIAPGGEPLYRSDVELCRRIFSAGCVVQNSLGTTETRTATQYFITPDIELDAALVPVGYAVEGKRILLLDDRLAEVDEGEIAVCSRYISPGYWRRPDLTDRVFLRNPTDGSELIYRTGDLGRRLEDGRIVHLGRKDFQVKIRGHRVEVEEVENHLLRLPEVDDAAVIAVPDHRGELRLAAYVVLKPGVQMTADELRNSCAATLPAACLPTAYFRVPELPKTSNGKLARRLVADLAGEKLPDTGTFNVAPRDEVETVLCTIFRQVLGCADIGIDDDFFDRGGDSLRAMDCLLQIERALCRRISPAAFLASCTVEHLARRITTCESEEEDPAIVRFSTTRHGLRLFLLPGLYGTVLDLKELAARVDERYEVLGLLPAVQFQSDDFQEIASEYTKRLVALQPAGAFRLAGYSFGGMLAFEVARQLRTLGRDISFLGIIDATPGVAERGPWGSPLRFLANVPLWLRDELSQTGLRALAQKIDHRFRRFVRRHSSGVKRSDRARMEDAYECRGVPETLREQTEAHLTAIARYRPPACELNTTLFKARVRPLLHSLNPELAWQRLTGGRVDVHMLAGNHETILRPPQLDQLSLALNAAMQKSG